MAQRRLSVVLDLDSGQYTGRMKQAGAATRSLSGNARSANTDLRRLGTGFDQVGRRMNTPLQKLRDYVLILGNLRFALINVRDIAVGWVGGLIKQSAEVERLTMLMKGLSTATTEMGRQTEAEESLANIYEMARKSGFAVTALADGYVKMKSAGLDPMDGSLQSLTDSVAAFGGTSDVMHRATVAIQQMAGKGVISMEELRQQLGEAVPTAMFAMARSMDMTVMELAKIVGDGGMEAGPALEKMFQELERMYAGSGKRMADTFNGQVAQFKTNLTELSTVFSGMDQGESPYMRQQRILLEQGKITLEQYQQIVDQSKQLAENGGEGVFANSINGMKELNELMRSNEGREFFANLGQIVNSVMVAIMNATRFVVRFKDEVGFAFKVMAAGIVLVQGKNFLLWLTQLSLRGVSALNGVTASVQKMEGPASNMVKRFDTSARALGRLSDQAKTYETRARAFIQSNAQQVNSLRAQTSTMRALTAEERANTSALRTRAAAHRAALNVGMAEGRFRSADTGRYISYSKAIGNANDAVRQLSMSRQRANALAARVRVVEAQLTGAIATQTAAYKKLDPAVLSSIQKKQRYIRVARTAAVASRAFGTAVNFLLGPMGILIGVLASAAYQAGIFTSQANKAAEAAARMAQGIYDVENAKKFQGRREQLATQERNLIANKKKNSFLNSDNINAEFDRKIAETRAEMAKVDSWIERNSRNMKVGAGSAYADAIRERIDVKRNAASAEFNTGMAALEKKGLNPKSAAYQKERQALVAKRDGAGNNIIEANMRQLREHREQLVKTGQSTVEVDAAMQGLEDQMSSSTLTMDDMSGAAGGVAGAVTGAGDAAARATPKLTEAQKAQKKFNNEIIEGAAEIAGLQAELGQVANEDLGMGKNEAMLKSKIDMGVYKLATKKQLDDLMSQAKQLDQLGRDLDFSRTISQLTKDMDRAGAEADQMWESLQGGTFEADLRIQQVKAQFGDVLEGITDPEKLAQVKALINDIAVGMQRADSAQVVHDLIQQSEEYEISLMDIEDQRYANYQREVERTKNLIAWQRLAPEERQRAEEVFYRWQKQKYREMANDSKGSTQRMAEDWSKMAVNMDQMMAQTMSSFIDGLSDAEFNMGEFLMSLLISIGKIILKALVAYAILSAIGATNGDGVKYSSMGVMGFMKQQMGDFGRSMAGQNTPAYQGAKLPGTPNVTVGPYSTPGIGDTVGVGVKHKGGAVGRGRDVRRVAASLFDSAQVFHKGGALGRGERPIIAKDGEIILNEMQQSNLAGKLGANVEVNVFNNSGTAMEAESSEPRFDGKKFVVDVILDAGSKPGPLRDMMSGAGKQNR